MSTRSRAETTEVRKLSELLARVEKASGPDREIDATIMTALVPYFSRPREYTASIDSAVALVEKVLPGWRWTLIQGTREGTQAKLIGPYPESGPIGNVPHTRADAKTPALALIAALLRAIISNGGK